MEEITPVYNQAIIEIICKENIKNASPLSGKRVQAGRVAGWVGGGVWVSRSSFKGNKTVVSQFTRITDKMKYCQETWFAVN